MTETMPKTQNQPTVRIIAPDGVDLPAFQSPGACGVDLANLDDVTIAPGEHQLIETGLVIEVPTGYMLQLAPRSSTYRKYGLVMPNSVGIVDQDYCGPTDTLKLSYRNVSDTTQHIPAGTRIAQGVFVAIAQPTFVRVEQIETKDRGGFGTTGE